MGAFSIWHWLIVLLVVVLVFGTKKLKTLGKDLGEGVKGFKDGIKEGEQSHNLDHDKAEKNASENPKTRN